ncbi:hypothetical protein B6S44_16965 [Bosea sp. Tri-44]|nr:hypothetical protein B6S44_16965 [Bosea sp. Tri-44]
MDQINSLLRAAFRKEAAGMTKHVIKGFVVKRREVGDIEMFQTPLSLCIAAPSSAARESYMTMKVIAEVARQIRTNDNPASEASFILDAYRDVVAITLKADQPPLNRGLLSERPDRLGRGR